MTATRETCTNPQVGRLRVVLVQITLGPPGSEEVRFWLCHWHCPALVGTQAAAIPCPVRAILYLPGQAAAELVLSTHYATSEFRTFMNTPHVRTAVGIPQATRVPGYTSKNSGIPMHRYIPTWVPGYRYSGTLVNLGRKREVPCTVPLYDMAFRYDSFFWIDLFTAFFAFMRLDSQYKSSWL